MDISAGKEDNKDVFVTVKLSSSAHLRFWIIGFSSMQMLASLLFGERRYAKLSSTPLQSAMLGNSRP